MALLSKCRGGQEGAVQPAACREVRGQGLGALSLHVKPASNLPSLQRLQSRMTSPPSTSAKGGRDHLAGTSAPRPFLQPRACAPPLFKIEGGPLQPPDQAGIQIKWQGTRLLPLLGRYQSSESVSKAHGYSLILELQGSGSAPTLTSPLAGRKCPPGHPSSETLRVAAPRKARGTRLARPGFLSAPQNLLVLARALGQSRDPEPTTPCVPARGRPRARLTHSCP